MDINIAFLNTQSDFSTSSFQPIENKQDFSYFMDNEVDLNKVQLETLELTKNKQSSKSNLETDKDVLKTEKTILALGKDFPAKKDTIKNTQSDLNEHSESNKNPEYIYGVMYNPSVHEVNEQYSNNDYIETTKIINFSKLGESISQEELYFHPEKTTESKELIINGSGIHELSENTYYTDARASFKLNQEYANVNTSENDSSQREMEDSILTSLIPSEFSIEGKTKNKTQSQLSIYDVSPEFNESTTIENELTSTGDAKNIQDPEITYDPSQTQIFEKELGEHLVSMVKENEHQVKLKINPPDLGVIDIDLNLENEQANVSFYTGNLQVMATIESSIHELKNMFNENNLFLADVNVFHQASDENKKHHAHSDELYKYENNQPSSIEKSTKGTLKPTNQGNISVYV